jgi:hypothetical protein
MITLLLKKQTQKGTSDMAIQTATAYETDNESLLKRLVKTAKEVGVAGSGLVLDVTLTSKVIDLCYYEGCVMARLNGVKPEIQPNDEVEILECEIAPGQGLDGFSHVDIPTLRSGTYIVTRVWYLKTRWLLELKGQSRKRTSLYPLGHFAPKPKVEVEA